MTSGSPAFGRFILVEDEKWARERATFLFHMGCGYGEEVCGYCAAGSGEE